jgi:hypothetical protein
MALKLVANYSKRLGLPGYSSHQFSVSCETEITNVEDVAAESARLYETLQLSVDEQIRQVGFVPDSDYGSNDSSSIKPINRIASIGSNANENGQWRCSDKQRELLLKLIADHNIEAAVQEMSLQMFGKHPKECNRLECSGLISRILEENTGKKSTKGKNGNGKYASGGMR